MKNNKLCKSPVSLFCSLFFCAGFLFCGFKLEKDVIQLSQTESVKAPEPGEEKKVKEAPASPTFKMDSFDDFMTSSPVQKTKDSKKVKPKPLSGHRLTVKTRKVKRGKGNSTY